MNRIFVLFAGLLVVAGMLPAIAQKNDKPRFLYVQNAGSMTLRDGTLTLTNVSPLTLFFSDRPERIAGNMRTEAFIKHWDKGTNSFKASPPNATVAVFRDATKISDAILEISEPKFDGTKLSYKAKVLLGDLPAEGGELSLFIDSGDAACDVGDGMYSGEPCWAQKAFDCPGRGGC
jgi:hypothetical protein